MYGPRYLQNHFFFVADDQKFVGGMKSLIESVSPGVFAGDNLVTWGKSLGFLEDRRFTEAFATHATEPVEKGAIWRAVTLAWAARQSMRVAGDLVECGCYKGTSARVLYDLLGLSSSERTFYLYDLFDGVEGVAQHALPAHGPELEAEVRRRFSDCENVVITAGSVPATFDIAAPEKIAFLHIDMNNAEAELGALDALFERVTPGGVIVLDDYGWLSYKRQQIEERRWFAERGYVVLELPTGQGMVIR